LRHDPAAERRDVLDLGPAAEPERAQVAGGAGAVAVPVARAVAVSAPVAIRPGRPGRDGRRRTGRVPTRGTAAPAGTNRYRGPTPRRSPIPCRDLARERLRASCDGLVPGHDDIREQRDLLAPVIDPPGDEQDRALLPGRAGLLVEPREDDDLDRALQVLKGDDGHRRARSRDD